MILSEREILERMAHRDPEKRLTITPIIDTRGQFQPSSIDLRLGTDFLMVKNARFPFLEVLLEAEKAEKEAIQYVEQIHVSPRDRFVLHPGEFALACTLEYIKIPNDLAGRLEGKSTWGRVGLQIHSTAGFVDPGFDGSLTFELQNVGKAPIPLYPGLRVAQISFYTCPPTVIPYSKKSAAHYGARAGLLPSKYYKMEDMRILRIIKESETRDK